VEGARHEAKRLDLDLKTAEEKVSKYKDQMHNVKTNEQLWALQEEIGHAESAVSEVETRILEQLEVADSLTAVIGEKKAEMVGETKRIDAGIAEADRREAELTAGKAEVEAAIAELGTQVPADLRKKYEGIKALRGGIGVAEVLDEVCLVCNTKVRPQHYVNTMNLVELMQCESCKRIIYVAEKLGLEDGGEAPAAPQMAPRAEPSAAAPGTTADGSDETGPEPPADAVDSTADVAS